jgi:hypothetical protein
MNRELSRVLEDAVVAYFDVLLRNSTGGKTLVRLVDFAIKLQD